MKTIYFAGGCFWGTEHYFKQVAGVLETQVGYANGKADCRPTYKEVCTDQTGFAETVRVVFDVDVTDVKFLTRMFFHAIDPLSVNRQGHDEGTQYRTGVYYVSKDQVPGIRAALDRTAEALGSALAVELLPLRNFYRAEEYHQDYLEKNPTGYCHLSPAIFRIAKEA